MSSQPISPLDQGFLTLTQLQQTAKSIVAMQEPSGAIPWTTGEHTDVWNHVEGAMAMLVGGQVQAAERAYQWCQRWQRHDGSWPMKIVNGVIEDASGETNMSAYLAVGVWHHWLIRQDRDFVQSMWPHVRAGLNFVARMQLPFGGIAWSQEWDHQGPAKVNQAALLAGSSSIFQSLRAGVTLARLVGEPQPEWELVAGRLLHALRHHRSSFLDKSEYSMDWYYPILGGAVRGDAAAELIAQRWDTFVEEGWGIRCIQRDPWVTGAETSELVMALAAIGRRQLARNLLGWVQRLRKGDGRYWTGYVRPSGVNWPDEQTTYTAAAIVLAADELDRFSPGGGIMAGDTLIELNEFMGDCGCVRELPTPRLVDHFTGLAKGAH